MSDIQDPSGAPETSVSDANPDLVNDVSDVKPQTVQYDTYKKSVGQAKKWKAIADDAQAKLLESEQSKLEVEGNKDELIESLRKQNQELDSKYKGAIGNFASGQGMSAIVAHAVKLGCTKTRVVERLVEGKMGTLDFDDGFNPNIDQVMALVEEVKQEVPEIFNSPGPSVASHTLRPSDSGVGDGLPSTIKQVKDQDMLALMHEAKQNELK